MKKKTLTSIIAAVGTDGINTHPDHTDTYIVRSEDGVEETFQAASPDAAEEHATAWLSEGDYATHEGPIRVHAYVWRADQTHTCDRTRVTYTAKQDVPLCTDDGEHNWTDRAVRSHGAGLMIHEGCTRCGCRRRTETQAQDRSTGEMIGSEVTYADDVYADDVDASDVDTL